MCYRDALCMWYGHAFIVSTKGQSCDTTKQHAPVKTGSVHSQNVWTHQATTQSARACCSSSAAGAVQEMNAESVPASEI